MKISKTRKSHFDKHPKNKEENISIGFEDKGTYQRGGQKTSSLTQYVHSIKDLNNNIQAFIIKSRKSVLLNNESRLSKLESRKSKLKNKGSISERLIIEDLNKKKLNNNENYWEDELKTPGQLNTEEAINKPLISPKINLNEKKINSENRIFFNESRYVSRMPKVYDSFLEDEVDVLTKDQFNILINPRSKGKLYWDYFTFFMVLISALYVPYHSSTEIVNNDSFGIEIFLEFIFIIDTIIHFFVLIENESGMFVANMKKIAFRYLENEFFIDFLSAFPFKFITYLIGNLNKNKPLSMFSKNSIYHWVSNIRILKLRNFSFFNDINIFLTSKFNSLLHLTIIFILLTHFTSCFWLYLGRYSNPKLNWILNANLHNLNMIEQYIGSVYFNLVTIYTIGYGDILSININEKIYNMFLLTFGVMIFTFGITNLSTMFQKIENSVLIYENKLRIFSEIEEEDKIPSLLKSKIKNQLFLDYTNNNSDRFVLLNSLTLQIKKELTLKMYEKTINYVTFFKNQTSDFIVFTLPFLQCQILNSKEILYEIGQHVMEMYIIIEGSFSLTLGALYENIELATLSKYNHFGDFFLHAESISPYELKSKSRISKVLILKKEEFITIKNNYASKVLNILKQSSKKIEKIEKRREEFLRLMKMYNSVSRVKLVIKKINLHLMEKGFNDYFNYGKDFDQFNGEIKEKDSGTFKNQISFIEEDEANPNYFFKIQTSNEKEFIPTEEKLIRTITESQGTIRDSESFNFNFHESRSKIESENVSILSPIRKYKDVSLMRNKSPHKNNMSNLRSSSNKHNEIGYDNRIKFKEIIEEILELDDDTKRNLLNYLKNEMKDSDPSRKFSEKTKDYVNVRELSFWIFPNCAEKKSKKTLGGEKVKKVQNNENIQIKSDLPFQRNNFFSNFGKINQKAFCASQKKEHNKGNCTIENLNIKLDRIIEILVNKYNLRR